MKRRSKTFLKSFIISFMFIYIAYFSAMTVQADKGEFYDKIGSSDSDVTTVGNKSYIKYSDSNQTGRLFSINDEEAYCVAESLHVRNSASYYEIIPDEDGSINEAGIKITAKQAKRISYIINADIGISNREEERLVKQAAIWLALGQISEGNITGGSDRDLAIQLADESAEGIKTDSSSPFENSGTLGFKFNGDTAISDTIKTKKDVKVVIESQSGTSNAATIEEYENRKWRIKVPVDKITGKVEVKVATTYETTEYNVPTLYMGIRAGHSYGDSGWATQFMVTNANVSKKPYTFRLNAEISTFKIKLHKTIKSHTQYYGNATPREAVYGVYSDPGCNNEVASITIVGDNGESSVTDWLPMMTYYIKEKQSSATTIKDDTVYTVDPGNATANGAGSDFGVTMEVSDWIQEGNLSVVKKDEHGNIVDGATFRITGPGGFDQTITTANKQAYRINNIPIGQYTITETNIKAGLYNQPENRTVNVTVNYNQTQEYVRTNPYQRGKVTLIKYDATNEIPLGDIRLAGAEFEFGAVNDIYEGDTLRYKAGKIETVVTDSDGKTKTFENLPIGKYYYTETKASDGCQRNTVTKYVEIRAQGQYESNAATYVDDDKTESANFERREIVYCPEEEIHVKLVITKQIDATDYDKEELLAGVQFKLTLDSDPSQVYYTHGSDGGELSTADGLCIKEDIPYGLYTIHEEKYPDTVIPVEDFKGNFTKTTNAFHGKVYDKDEDGIYFVHNKPKTINVAVEKKLENEFVNKTDAKVSGAIFTIYKDEECKVPYVSEITGTVVTVGPTNDDGYAKSGEMRTRNYWMKETTFPKDMDEDIVDPNAQLYENPEGTTYKDMVYAIKASTVTQTVRNVVNTSVIKNKPDTGKVVMVKFDDNHTGTDDTAAVNAKVRLTLKSNPEVYYDCVIDSFGMAEFENETVATMYYKDLDKKDVYSIPYGIYELSEIKESDDGSGTDWFFQKHEIQVVKAQGTTYSVIEGDMDVNFMLKIAKFDDDTHERVYLAGGKYKVYDMQKNDWVKQYIHTGVSQEDSTPLEVFTTNNQGELRLPEYLPAGEYMVYEVEAPKGYFLNEKYRIPTKAGTDEEDKSKLGKEEFGGIYVDARKTNLQIASSAEYPTNPIEELRYALDHLEYSVDAYDKPLKFQIKLYKTGDMFTNVEEKTYNENGITEEYKTPVYTKEGLNGVTFKITAVEDIWSEDGTEKYREAGWSTTMTTGENGQADGYALSEKLYNGKYKVEEIVTPVGYKKCDAFEVDEHNYDQYNEVLQVSKEADNEYQHVKVSFEKLFEYSRDDNSPIYLPEGKTIEEVNKDKIALFGLYTNQDLTTIKNGKTIKEGDLIAVIKAESDKTASIEADLPDGEYYLKELYVSEPYELSEDNYVVTVDHTTGTNEDEIIEVEGLKIPNGIKTKDFTLLKTTSTDVLNFYNIPVVDKETDEKIAKELLETYTNDINVQLQDRTVTIEKILNDLRDRNIRLLSSAKYELFADEECKTHMVVSYDKGATFNRVVVESEEEIINGETIKIGKYVLVGLPEGEYYLKETESPVYLDSNGHTHTYDEYEGPIKITIKIQNDDYDSGSTNPIQFKMISDESPIFEIDKTDIFTDEGIPNCLFTITDKNNVEKLRFVTNDEGKSEIPTDIFVDGETYYFTEIDAPKYPYYDGDVLYELNTEPHKFIAHVDEEGKWKLKGVDEEGNEETYDRLKIQNYRTRTNVELQKLDMVDSTPIPNCKFVLESKETGYRKEGVTDDNGIYIFKDVPYGKYTYTELEAPEGWMIDTTPHEFTLDSHGTKIVVYDEKIPTGDIAVIAIACVAVISIAGIAFVVIKNKKSKSSK